MDFRTSISPLFRISKVLCTMAFTFDKKGAPVKSKSNKVYIARVLAYTITFIGGNFYVTDVVATGNLDAIAFIVANTMLITLSVYGMVWSIVSQEKQLKLLRTFQGHNIRFVVGMQVVLLGTYYTTMGVVVAFISNFDAVLVTEYAIFFVLPDVSVYTVLFQFINAVIILRQKFITLNEETSMETKGKNIQVLARTHQDLYLLSVRIRKFYGFFCLWILATFFLWIMCDLYRFVNVVLIAKSAVDETLASSIIASVAHYGAILWVTAVCNSTKTECRRFKILFARALVESGDERSGVKKRLSLTLIHQNVNFTALDWFELDYLLFYSMSASIITYLVVLVQLND